MTRIAHRAPAVKTSHAAAAAHTKAAQTPKPTAHAQAIDEPNGAHKGTHWVTLKDYLGTAKAKGLIKDDSQPAPIFSRADGTIEATGRDNEQQDIGDCFWCSSFSTLAMHDKPLMKEHIRQVGTMPDGTNLYGVVMYAKEGSPQAGQFQRAANDVVHADADGKPVRYTPVWVVVSDKIPVDKDGDIDASSVVVAGKNNKVMLGSFLSEKAAALFAGPKGYKELDKGGDAAQVLEMLTGFPGKTVDMERAMDPAADKALADQQFKSLIDASRNGQQFVLGTWGNNKVNAKKSLADQDSIAAVLKYPQYTPDGKVATDPFFKPNFVFQDGTGEADHNTAKTTTGEGAGLVGDHDYAGIGAFEDGKFKGLGFDGTAPIIELRNPWGSVRPPEFSDGRPVDDGVVRGPWYTLRTLVGSISIGGRPTDQRKSLEGVVAPTLPPGTTSTFALVDGETAAATGSDGYAGKSAGDGRERITGEVTPRGRHTAPHAAPVAGSDPTGGLWSK
jgi:hypothetical protein